MLKKQSVRHYLPFGYKRNLETNEIEISESEAKVVQIIFNMYRDGYGLYDIYYHLKDKGYKTRNGIDFKPASISVMLGNDSYIGNYTYNKSKVTKINGKRKRTKINEKDWVTIDNVFPPIIDKKTFDIINEKKRFYRTLRQTGGNYNGYKRK